MIENDIGLKYISNFITDKEQSYIVDSIINFKLENPKLVANYGETNYNSIYFGERYHKKTTEYPDYLQFIVNRLIDKQLLTDQPIGIAINEYKKGQKIGAHIDKPISGPIVTILSLSSVSTMVFKNKKDKIVQTLEPKSIVQITGEIREKWTHEILPVKDMRYSIIFRSKQ